MKGVKKIGVATAAGGDKVSKRAEPIRHAGPVESLRFLPLAARRAVTSETNTGSK